ncbi:MAG: hypothetical protein OEX07_03350 [Gammaproteobacteria bacterium]|nr:hypothetical protein [Gammaproteobacteria bacterium]
MSIKGEEKHGTVGCYSEDPDNDKHNWPEYTHNEDGDQVLTCKCGVDFFGYLHRETCCACRDA